MDQWATANKQIFGFGLTVTLCLVSQCEVDCSD